MTLSFQSKQRAFTLKLWANTYIHPPTNQEVEMDARTELEQMFDISEIRDYKTEAGVVKYRLLTPKSGIKLHQVSAETVQNLKNGTFKEGDTIKVFSKTGTIREGILNHFVLQGSDTPYSFYPMVRFPRNKDLVRIGAEMIFPATMSDAEILGEFSPEQIVKRQVNQYSEEEITVGISHIFGVFKEQPMGWGIRMWEVTKYSDDDRERLMRQAALRRMIKDGLVIKAGRDRYNLTKAGQKKAKGQEQ